MANELSRYETWELDAMVEQIERPNPWLLRTFFNRERLFSTKVIEFDLVDKSERRLAPFVSPFAAGKVMRREGYRTKQLAPAYVKPIALVTPQESFTRLPGEGYGGALSPRARFDRIVAETLDTHMNAIEERLEWMAAQALVNGAITISGEGYPTTYVDFGRDPSLSIFLTGASKWTAGTATPMTDIENASLQVRMISKGAVITDLIMDGATWAALRTQSSINDLISAFYRRNMPGQAPTSIDAGPRNNMNEAQFVGSLNGRFNLWVYDLFYQDDAGNDVPHIPPYTVLGLSSAIEGSQYYGAIMDLHANMEPRKSFSKSEVKFDPSGLELVTQSAPLVAPKRPNAMFVLHVA